MMPNMPPDSHKISLKIIEAIKQHPILYISEVKGPSIKLQEFRQKVWKRISDELGLDPTWVRLRWKNLRDTYCRILKYKNKTEKGMRRKKWIFEDHLSFLKFPYENDYQPQYVELTEEYIQEINAGGISSEGLLEQLEDRNDEDYSEYLEVLEETMADPISENAHSMGTVETIEQIANEILEKTEIEKELKNEESNNYPQQTQSKYRKIRPKRTSEENQTTLNTFSILSNPIKSESINVDSSIISQQFLITRPVLTPFINPPKESNIIKEEKDKIYTDFENKTSVQLFFDSMAQTVKRLPPKAQADIKMSICRIVTEAEVRHSGRKKSQASPKPTKSPKDMPKLVLIPCSMIDTQNHQDAS